MSATRKLSVAPTVLSVAAVVLSARLGFTPSQARAAAAVSKPNIVVILADDLGYGDTGAYGSKIVLTPNIDALAASGVRFTDGYVTHPVCSPSRAGLMTGRYQERYGWEFNPKGRDKANGVSLNEIMLPKVMKEAGYTTGMIGKWHLGQPGPYYPAQRGFDFFFGFAGGGSVYIIDPKPGDAFEGAGSDDEIDDVADARPAPDITDSAQLRLRLEAARERAPITRNGVPVHVTEYQTDAFTREGVNFIDQHRNQPFFLYMAYHAPHKPLQATKKYYDRFPEIALKPLRIHTAMISAMDDGVGALVAKLKADGLDKNTIIFFLSDNGCPSSVGEEGACSNAPLVGFKRTHFEGGVRVPFIVSWPGHVPAGRVDSRVVSSLDIFPTAVAAAGGKLPADRAYDGVDLMPFLTSKLGDPPNPTLYWRAGPNFAIRDGGWKMMLTNKARPGEEASSELKSQGNKRLAKGDKGNKGDKKGLKGGIEDPSSQPPTASPFGQHTMLYDLSQSPTETLNLATQRPAIVSSLKGKIDAWNKLLVPPQWISKTQHDVTYDGVRLHLYD
jgi:arylsulfatase A-like enzyme